MVKHWEEVKQKSAGPDGVHPVLVKQVKCRDDREQIAYDSL